MVNINWIVSISVILLGRSAESRILPNGFFLDIDGISIAPSSGHICALEAKPGLDIGGPSMCWGADVEDMLKGPSESFVQIVCGTHFACGVTLYQRVLCWGQGVPSEVEGLYSQISAGTNFACGVMTDGHVNCWGVGLLNHGLSETVKFVQVSCGSSHCCALDTEGLVHCWGRKRSADLTPPKVTMKVGSDGDLVFATPEELPDPSVVDSEELEDFENNNFYVVSDVEFKQISVGDGIACGIQFADSRVRCWGDIKRQKLTSAVWEGSFRQVSVGSGGICAILSNTNQLQCAGLATIRIADRAVELEWDQVRVGKYNVCGVTMESQLICAGVSVYDDIPEDFRVA